MTRNRIFWALILVLLGAILLMNNLDILDVAVWSLFWPSLLILLGIWFLWGSLSRTPPKESEVASVPLDGATEAHVQIKHGAGRLQVRGEGDGDELISGSFGWGLAKEIRREGSKLFVTLRPRHGVFPDVIFPWSWTSGGGLDWDVSIRREIPLTLSFETGAGEARLDLSQLQVKDLRIQTGASSTQLTLPQSAGHTDMRLEAGVASVSVKVPEKVAAKIRTSGGLASIQVDQNRFLPDGEIYKSAEYESAENKVEMRIETGVGSVKVQ